MPAMDFPNSPVNGQTTTDGRYYFDSSVGTSGAWRSTPLPVGGLPAGSIMAWGTNTPPANWLIADGSAVSRSTYSSLFAVIGTQYGAGNGTTTFNLPDLRGRVPVGRNGGTFGTLAGTGGAETHSLSVGEMPNHTHTFSGTTASDGAHQHNIYLGSTQLGYTNSTASVGSGLGAMLGGNNNFIAGTPGSAHAHSFSGTTAAAGSGTAHNNLQPYLVVNYIIKATAGWTAGDSELATRLGAVETASATTNRAGLVPVVPASVVTGAGSASVSANGTVTFANASTVLVNSAFSSTFSNYRIVLNINVATNDYDLGSRFATAGTVATATAYFNAGERRNQGGTASSYGGGGFSTLWYIGGGQPSYNTGKLRASMDIYSPFLGAGNPTMAICNAFGTNPDSTGFSIYNTGTSHDEASRDGFQIFPTAGTISGTMRVYGYRE